MKNIVVAIEFDNDKQVLVDKAFELAKPFNAKVWLLHIVAPDPDFVGYEAGPQSVRDSRAKDLREKHAKLQNEATDMKSKGVTSEALLIQGPTIKTLLSECEKLNADLIIAGYEDHSLFHKILIGANSSKILKNSRIPVLFVPIE